MARDKIIYWTSTGLLSLMMTAAAAMYFFNHAEIVEEFSELGFPTYLIYPLATLKLLGVLAILTKKVRILKDLAYAGFLYDFLLAGSAHINAGDDEFVVVLVALVLLVVSYLYDRKLYS